MTASQIFTRIEEKLTQLELGDLFGEPLLGNEVLPTLMASDPGRLELLQDQVLSQVISWEQYGQAMENWVEEWSRDRYRRKLAVKFERLLTGKEGENEVIHSRPKLTHHDLDLRLARFTASFTNPEA